MTFSMLLKDTPVNELNDNVCYNIKNIVKHLGLEKTFEYFFILRVNNSFYLFRTLPYKQNRLSIIQFELNISLFLTDIVKNDWFEPIEHDFIHFMTEDEMFDKIEEWSQKNIVPISDTKIQL